MADIDIFYHINDAVTAMAGEQRIAFATEEIEDAVLDELTHAIAVRFGLEEPEEAPTMTGAHGTAPGGVLINKELESIFDHLTLAASILSLDGTNDPDAISDLTDLIAYRFGYPVARPIDA